MVQALGTALEELPNLCILVESVIPEKIKDLSDQYNIVEKSGVPLFNLSFWKKVDKWNAQVADVRQRLIDLNTTNVWLNQ